VLPAEALEDHGMTLVRREPKMKPEIARPVGPPSWARWTGTAAWNSKARVGCAAGPSRSPGPPLPVQSAAGASVPMPSHQGSFDGVMATFVKMVLERTIWMPFGLVARWYSEPPKEARSGLMARSWPWAST